MKTFDFITEADARVLQRGETVTLSRRGHVTPLAHDTLRERRITVLREGSASAEDLQLAPPAAIRTLAIASDHTGVTLRRDLIGWLRGRGLAVTDHGVDGSDPVDYPDVAALVARAVARGEADAGIVIDGAGIGSAIAANKLRGIRAAMATTDGRRPSRKIFRNPRVWERTRRSCHHFSTMSAQLMIENTASSARTSFATGPALKIRSRTPPVRLSGEFGKRAPWFASIIRSPQRGVNIFGRKHEPFR